MMNTGFTTEVLAQKLARLNISQQSIETLSHWCVFHHRYFRQVVETWDSVFHSAPLERKISLLYLANDIMQNSKKDGMRYINEFWRVIAAALNDVFTNGDDFGRNVVQRLVAIWEDRKLFGTQGQLLKEDYDRKFEELKYKSKKPGGELVEKVISSYKHMLCAPIDEDTLMRKCNIALSFVDNLNKEYGNSYLGSNNGSGFVEELREQHSTLRNTIEQFKTSESLRATLISDLKEALHEQEFKMELVRSQLRAAQSRYKKADDLCQKLGIDVERQEPSNKGLQNSSLSEVPVTSVPDSANVDSHEKEQSTAVMYSQEGDGNKHEILNDVLSSRATRDNIEQKIEEHSSGNKRQKLENGVCAPQPQSPPPPPPFPHPDTFQQPPPPPQYPPSPESSPPPPPPPLPPSMPPPIPPPPPTTTNAFMPVPAAPMAGMPYNVFPSFPPVVNYPMINMPPPFPGAPNPHPGFQGLGGPFYGPPFPAAPPPMNRK